MNDLKNKLSAYLRRLRAGWSVIVRDRDAPVALIEGIESVGSASDRLAKLQADGQVRSPLCPLSVGQLRDAAKRYRGRSGLLEALLQNRQDGSTT